MKLLLVLLIIICSSNAHCSDVVKIDNIDKISKDIIAEIFDIENIKFDLLRKHWYNKDTVETIISSLSGQMMQFRPTFVSDYGEINPRNSILLGSKSLPKFLKILYLLDGSKTQIPVALVWNERDGKFYLTGIVYGNACVQDMWEFSSKHQGAIEYEKVKDSNKIDSSEIDAP